jgi:hypothetical protein
VTDLLRLRLHLAALLALSLSIAPRRALAEPPQMFPLPGESQQSFEGPPPDSPTAIEPGADPAMPLPSAMPADGHHFMTPPTDDVMPPESEGEPQSSDEDWLFSELKWLGLRHSSTSGRNAGLGIPLTSSSWLNRPFYVGADIGTVWLTRQVQYDVSTDTDTYGGIFAGYDWDYYWGTELSVQRATPELVNSKAPDAVRGDRMMEWTTSLMYYPWGDAVFRPYWRLGIGSTDIDYPMDNGHRRDEELWTFPIGVGLAYPLRPFLAARAEFADQIALGNTGVATQHDLTLTFALEWRFGAHPRSYWPWNPSRHIW